MHTEHTGADEPAEIMTDSSLSALASKAPMLSSCVRPSTRNLEASTLMGSMRRSISAVMCDGMAASSCEILVMSRSMAIVKGARLWFLARPGSRRLPARGTQRARSWH